MADFADGEGPGGGGGGGSGSGSAGSRSSARSPSQLFFSDHDFKVGDRIALVSDPETFGTIEFIGSTDFASGEWVGVALDEARGKNDGSVQGKRYFVCEQSKGLFLRPNALVPEASAANLPRGRLSAGDIGSGLRSERNSLSSPTRKASLPTGTSAATGLGLSPASLERSQDAPMSPASLPELGSRPSALGASGPFSGSSSTEALSTLLTDLRKDILASRAESQEELKKLGADLASLRAAVGNNSRSSTSVATTNAGTDSKLASFQAQLNEHRSAVEAILDQKLTSMSQLKAAGDSPLILAAIGRVLEKVSGKPADLDLSPILEDNAMMKRAISERPAVDLSPVLMAIDDIKVSVPDKEEMKALKQSLQQLKASPNAGVASGSSDEVSSALQALREARLELQAFLDADRYKVRTSISLPPESGLAGSGTEASAANTMGDLPTVLSQLAESRAAFSESLGQISQDIDQMKRLQSEELPLLKKKMSTLVDAQANLQSLTENMRSLSSVDELRKKARKSVSFSEETPMTFASSELGVVSTKSSMRNRKSRDTSVELEDVLDAIEDFKDAAVEAVANLTIDVDLEPVLDAINSHRANLDDSSIELLKECLRSEPPRPNRPEPVLVAIEDLRRGMLSMQQQLQNRLQQPLQPLESLQPLQHPEPLQPQINSQPQLLTQQTRLTPVGEPEEDVSSPSSSVCPPLPAESAGVQSELQLVVPTAALATAAASPPSLLLDDATVARVSDAVARATEEQVNRSFAILKADFLVAAAGPVAAGPGADGTRPADCDVKLEQRVAAAVAAGLSAEAVAMREREAAMWQRECRTNAAAAVSECLGAVGEQLQLNLEHATALQQQLQEATALSLQQQRLRAEEQQAAATAGEEAVAAATVQEQQQRELSEETKKMAGSLEDLAGMVEVMALAITDLKSEVQGLATREDSEAVDISPVLEAIRHQRLQIDEAALATLRGDVGGSSQQLLSRLAEDVASVKSWVQASGSSVTGGSQDRLYNPSLSQHRAEEFQAVLLSKFSDLRSDIDQIRLSAKAATSAREPDMEPVLEALRKHRSEMAVSMGVLLSEKRIAQGLTAIKETINESVRQSIQQDLYGLTSPPPTISSAMPGPHQAAAVASQQPHGPPPPAPGGSSAKRTSKSQPPPPISTYSSPPAEPAVLEGGIRYAVQGYAESSASLAHTTGPSTSRKSVPKLRKRPSQQSQSSDSTVAGPLLAAAGSSSSGGAALGRRYTEEAREIIKAFDTNGDGMISKSEFKEAMRRRQLSPGPQ